MFPNLYKKLGKIFVCVAVLVNVCILIKVGFSTQKDAKSEPKKISKKLKMIDKTDEPIVDADGRIDWHDYAFMAYEKSRKGPGEQGKPHKLTDEQDIYLDKHTFNDEGFSCVVSDQISPNRSLPDIRHDNCKTKRYMKNLPKTSVIVIFFNENWSLILRCLNSIWNRTPKSLLHEIILVDDMSSKADLHYALKGYITEHFDERVKLFKNSKREGLIRTRMFGAKQATGEVIVFLDSHMEVNVNWLPPLLEPIVFNPKTASVPILDSFSPWTLEYELLGHGTRGGFDWGLVFKWMPMRPQDEAAPGEPFEYPVMTGGGYAIRREYFFELGGYDEGMMIWNGENYELSFKIWLCGGRMLQIPCSHVAHTSKLNSRYKRVNYGFDYSARNLKRVAEVWMDDYKQELYLTDPDRYEKADAGDLTEAFALKKRLNCKPFQWFLDNVAPEICDRYQPHNWGIFAQGTIISDADPNLCVTFQFKKYSDPLTLTPCSENKTHPSWGHYFIHTWGRQIKLNDANWQCVDSSNVALQNCHFNLGHQLWKYDLGTHMISNPPHGHCFHADLEKNVLVRKSCNETDINQKFSWGYTNVTAYENWKTYGIKVPFEI